MCTMYSLQSISYIKVLALFDAEGEHDSSCLFKQTRS